MYTITGATGHVGSATTERLVAGGHPTRIVVRDPQRAPELDGVDVAVADLTDREGLAAAFDGSSGCFVLLPFNPLATDIAAEQSAMIDAIGGAVADAAVPHVAMLSSLGADLADGPRILRWLGDLEDVLRSSGAVVSAVRCTHFQEKIGEVLDAARGGVYPVFGDDVDRPSQLVATTDIGAVIAATLLAPPRSHQVIDVLGPTYTERQLAAALGGRLGTELAVAPLPPTEWVGALTAAGFADDAAELVAGLYRADLEVPLRPTADLQVVGETPVEATIDRLLATTTASA